MKVENNGKVQVLDHLVKSATTKSSKQTAAGQMEGQQQGVDTVELSERASTLEKLKGKAKATPAIRQEKIDAIKQAIANKTYNVKSEDVARSLLKNHIMDEILKP
jgi:flagellar biosynthesis anti-sigma factor FlgM